MQWCYCTSPDPLPSSLIGNVLERLSIEEAVQNWTLQVFEVRVRVLCRVWGNSRCCCVCCKRWVWMNRALPSAMLTAGCWTTALLLFLRVTAGFSYWNVNSLFFSGYSDSEAFSWEKYLEETNSQAAPARAFKLVGDSLWLSWVRRWGNLPFLDERFSWQWFTMSVQRGWN